MGKKLLWQWVSTEARRHPPETSLVCASYQQKERIPALGRHLHSAETQLSFLCRWGYHISQLHGKYFGAVSEQSENVVAVFIPGNWAAGRWLQLSLNGTLTKLSSFCYSFHVPQFHLIWYFYLSKELWYVSVYVHVHMFLHVCTCKDAHTSIWTGRWNLDDTKNNESSFIDSSGIWN